LTSDEEAEFTAMVLRQSRFVFRVAYAVLLNAHDAEDAAQETFLKLYRNGGWRGMENERAFLARTAWRVAQDCRRHMDQDSRRQMDQDSRRHIAVMGKKEPAAGEPANHEPPSTAPSPEQNAVASNSESVVHAMIDALPEDLRLPLILSAFEELNSREIGGILSIPEGTVRTRIQRARQMLREKLAAQEIYHGEARHAR
jgi:RNA polymerase sigma-70 factor, ECF subfamily